MTAKMFFTDECSTKMILHIDRSIPFNPATFNHSNLLGTSRFAKMKSSKRASDLIHTTRSLPISEIDISKIQFKNYFSEGGVLPTDGEKRLKSVRASGDNALDAKVGQTLYEEPGQKSLNWLYENRGITSIEFAGEVLCEPVNLRHTLCLHRHGNGIWHWYYSFLGDKRYPSDFVVVFHG